MTFPLMERPARIALLGCGLIGRQHIRAWEAVALAAPGTFEIVAVADTDPAAGREAAGMAAAWQRTEPAVFEQAEALLDGILLDGLDICLPVHLHKWAACAALERGVHVLVEKPLAATVAEGKHMISAADRAARVLSLAENHRRTPTIRTARWLLRERDEIGVPEIFHAQRSRYQAPEPQPWHWRADRRLGGGGWALDNGAHLIDTLRYLFGPVESVSAVAKRTIDQPLFGGPDGASGVDDREDLLAGLLRFSNGMTGIFSQASRLPGDEHFRFSIQGSEGAIVDHGGQLFHAPLPTALVTGRSGARRQLSDYQAEFIASLSEEEHNRLFPFGLWDDFPVECGEFLRAIISGMPVEIDGRSGLETLATSLAFYESAVSGSTVRVADVLDGTVSAYQMESAEQGAGEADPPGLDLVAFRTRWERREQPAGP